MEAFGQLSATFAVGSRSAEHSPGSLVSLMSDTVMTGGVSSTTVTFAVQESEAPLSSVTVNVTLVTPRAYGPAADRVMVMGSPSGSLEPPSISASA